MRPIRLEMQAFESYLDKTVLDFDKLGTKGLYLIDGPTGAGKTTLFQAIFYALYGETLGESKKEGNIETTDEDLRNNKAAMGRDTYVDLIFKEKDYTYHIHREPSQKKLSKKKTVNGYVESNAYVQFSKVELDENNNIIKEDKISDKSKDVKEKIESLLGLDSDQFEKTILIPQGKFIAVLSQNTEKRTEIFRSLFGTERYYDFVQTLNKKANDAQSKLSQELQSQNKRFEYCKVNESDVELAKKKEDLKSYSSVQEKIDFLNLLISKYETLSSEYKEKRDVAKEEVNKWSIILNESYSYTKRKDTLIELEGEVSTIKKDLAESKNNVSKLESEEDKYNNYNKEAIELSNKLHYYDDLSKAESSLDTCTKNLNRLGEEKRINEEDIKKLDESIDSIQKELSSIKTDPDSELNDLNQRFLPLITNFNSLIKSVESNIYSLNQEKDYLTSAIRKREEAALLVSKETNIANEISKKFFANQAGELASSLQDNQPCPVCGSKDHPRKAILVDDSITKQMMEEARNNASKAESMFSKAEADEQHAREDYDSLLPIILEALKEYGTTDEESIPASFNKLKSEAFKSQYEYDEKKEKLIGLSNLKKRLTCDLTSSQENKYKLEKILSNINIQCLKDSTSIANYQKEIKKIKDSLPYPTMYEASARVNELSSLYNNYKNDLNSAKKTFDILSNTLSDKNGQIKTLSNQIKEYENHNYPSNSVIEENLRGVTNKENELNDAYNSYSSFAATNKEVLKDINESLSKSFDLQKMSDRLNHLSSTYGGKSSSDNSKSTIEIYVQGKQLDRVLNYANKRLLAMTDNQFSMTRASKAYDKISASGLDIDIVDNQNISNEGNRKVVTLSGGESFKAALSLALGLRDAVAAHKGGTDIECMYIDEGFGTLDNESLDKVIEVLMQQTVDKGNCLVGVISHVEELQNKIQNKIKVYKDDCGNSHLKMIVPSK